MRPFIIKNRLPLLNTDIEKYVWDSFLIEKIIDDREIIIECNNRWNYIMENFLTRWMEKKNVFFLLVKKEGVENLKNIKGENIGGGFRYYLKIKWEK